MGSVNDFLSTFGATPAPDSHETLDNLAERPGSLAAFVNEFGGASESFWFYDRTEELRFDRTEWKWYKVDPELGNLTELYGVTSVVKRADNPAALIPWAAKMAIDKLLRTIPTQVLSTGPNDPSPLIMVPSMTLAQFTAIALEAKSAHKEKFEDAGDVGHMAHACIEQSIKAALLTPEKIVRELIALPSDPRAVTCAQSAKGWMDAHNVRWVETESKVYSKEHQYAGTMDGLCIVDSCNDPACCSVVFKNVLSVADWKSSNRLRISYIFQVAAYKKAKMEEFGGSIPDCWILRLGKENEEFEPWHLFPEDFEDDFAGYVACLELLKIVDTVEERLTKQRHSVTAIKKEQKAVARDLAKAQEKLAKAMEKAEKKAKQLEEKARIKAEAKAERERLRAETKAQKLTLSPADQAVIVEAAKRHAEIETEDADEYIPPAIPTEDE